MSLLDQLKTQLQSKGLWAQKGLGQNFLVDEKALDTIVMAADLSEKDHVVEVGPGTGFLTEQLIQRAGRVTSVELDQNMADILHEQFKFTENLEIVNQDALSFKVPKGDYKVVANIPYYITSPLIKHFLQSESRPSLMVLLVQREVAEKVCGVSGKSLITIETQLFGKPEIAGIVKASSFYPVPKVDSAILKINVYGHPLLDEMELNSFLRIVKFGFSQKRKKLANSLGAGLHMKPAELQVILKKIGLEGGVRAENLSIEEWKKLANALLTK